MIYRMTDRELYESCLPLWAKLYVEGHWTLEQFETHADRMREALVPVRPQSISRLGEQGHGPRR